MDDKLKRRLLHLFKFIQRCIEQIQKSLQQISEQLDEFQEEINDNNNKSVKDKSS